MNFTPGWVPREKPILWSEPRPKYIPVRPKTYNTMTLLRPIVFPFGKRTAEVTDKMDRLAADCIRE